MQPIGRSRGGQITKVHVVANSFGRLIVFKRAPRRMSDVPPAHSLIEQLPAAERVLTDTACDSDEFRELPEGRGSVPTIKPNPTRNNIPSFDERLLTKVAT